MLKKDTHEKQTAKDFELSYIGTRFCYNLSASLSATGLRQPTRVFFPFDAESFSFHADQPDVPELCLEARTNWCPWTPDHPLKAIVILVRGKENPLCCFWSLCSGPSPPAVPLLFFRRGKQVHWVSHPIQSNCG